MAARVLNFGQEFPQSGRQSRTDLGLPMPDLSNVWAELVIQANTFVYGQFVSTGTTWVLGSYDDRGEEVDGMVAQATATFFYVAMTPQPLRLLAHGLGPAGTTIWSGLAGAPTGTKPSVGTVKNLQRIGRVTGPDSIFLRIEHPSDSF